MALAATTHITSVHEVIFPAGTLTATTAAFTPPDNSLLVVMIGVQGVNATAGTPAMSGGGLTWTNRIGTSPSYTGPDYFIRGSIWTAPVTTGASMTVTYSDGETVAFDQGSLHIHVISETGYDTASPTGATISNTTAADAALTITLNATPASTSEIFALRMRGENATEVSGATPGTGWAEIAETAADAGYGDFQSQRRAAGSTLTSVIWDDTSTNPSASSWGRHTIALEIKAAAEVVATGAFRQQFLFRPGGGPAHGLKPTQAYPAEIVLRTITAEAGAYAITGTAATLLHKRVAAANAGSYAVTGTAATLRRTYLLAADAGSYAITGTAASLEYGYVLAAEAGTYAITGTAATLTRTYVLSATAGSYTITGTAADLIYAAGRILTADAGSYAISGTAATLSRTYILSAVGGSYTIAGTAASLLHKYVLAADSGVYTITGTAVSLLQKYVLSADAGAYTITGTDATLLKSGAIVLPADSGVYTITGTAADLIYNVPSPAGGGLKHYPARRIDISKPRPRQFGRKCWEELKAAHAAQLALERKAEKAKQEGARQALLQASHEAQEAILAVLEAAAVNAACEHEVGRLARSLQAAVGAKSLTGVISTTDAVMAAAAALEREIEDEDETIILLLS